MHSNGGSYGDSGDYDWSWQNEISLEEDLPKRSEYNNIKDFSNYEFTQCVVYEIAIRNPRYKEEVDYVMAFYNKHKQDIDFSIENKGKPIARVQGHHIDKKKGSPSTHHARYIELQRFISNIEVVPINFNNNTLEYKDVKTFGKDFYNLLDYILKHAKEKDSNRKTKPLIETVTTVKKQGFLLITKVNSSQQPALYVPTNTKDRNSQIKERKKHRPNLPQTGKEYFNIAIKYNEDKNSNVARKRLSSRDLIQSSIRIKESLKRPKVRLNNGISKDIKLEIDLSRPKEEIIAYIEYLKDYINENNEQIQSPLSLLGASLFGTDYPPNKNKSITKNADKFSEMLFVYDYIETRKRNNEKYNRLLEANLQEKLTTIENVSTFAKNKTKAIKEATDYYTKNKVPVSASLLQNNEMTMQDTKLTSGTIKNYYDKINSFLINERYKELISENL